MSSGEKWPLTAWIRQLRVMADQNKVIYEPVDLLQKKTGRSRSGVIHLLLRLEKRGWIRKVRVERGAGIASIQLL